jgi:hypothetical protein
MEFSGVRDPASVRKIFERVASLNWPDPSAANPTYFLPFDLMRESRPVPAGWEPVVVRVVVTGAVVRGVVAAVVAWPLPETHWA